MNAVPQRLTAVVAYSGAGIGAVALVSLTLYQSGGGRWALIPALIGISGLVFHWRSAPLGFVAAVAFGKVMQGWYFGAAGLRRLESLAGDGVLCLGVLAYIIAQYRLLSLQVGVFPPDPREPSRPLTREPSSVPMSEYFSTGLAAIAATIAAFFLWEVTLVVRPPWNLARSYWRVELLTWLLATGLIVTAAVLRYLGWRRQSPAEALFVLRDEFWRQTRGEQRRTNRWLAWARRRHESAGRNIDS